MTDIAIKVENLGKAYRLGAQAEKADTLVEALLNMAKAPLRNFRRLQRLNTFNTDRESDDILWALKGVSFEVQRGDVLGFVGRNGAGKSTLLKILSRITEPTEGRVEIHGRVSSLLEVGTGFHPELTGRENVYMNGTILGMKKAEINRKFDEIVEFSGVERFLDTPVKWYSSGMKVRLAFSVAAHLEPEILIVDEVLAVGDAEFQKKCLGKMQDVAGGGRTVLFVSHNMGAVQNLCSRAVALRNGQMVDDGSTEQVIRQYLANLLEGDIVGFSPDNKQRKITGNVKLTSGRLLNDVLQPIISPISGSPLIFEVQYENPQCQKLFDIWFTVVNEHGVNSFKLSTSLTGFRFEAAQKGLIRCRIPKLPLTLGRYRVAIAILVDGVDSDVIPSAFVFDVSSSCFHTG